MGRKREPEGQESPDVNAPPAPTLIRIEWVLKSPQAQVREKIDRNRVLAYRRSYELGEKLPPIKLAKVGNAYLLIDGWHRLAAKREMGETHVDAVFVDVSEDDVLWEAAKANFTHGLPLKTKEIRQAFRLYMKAKRYRRSRSDVKSLGEIEKDFGGIRSKTTFSRWIAEDFPWLRKHWERGDDQGPYVDPDETETGLARALINEAIGNLRAALGATSDGSWDPEAIREIERELIEITEELQRQRKLMPEGPRGDF